MSNSCFTAAYLRIPFGYQTPLGMTANTQRSHTSIGQQCIWCHHHPNHDAGPRGEKLSGEAHLVYKKQANRQGLVNMDYIM